MVSGIPEYPSVPLILGRLQYIRDHIHIEITHAVPPHMHPESQTPVIGWVDFENITD
jgi:hypothetical protein